jgi:hypothetical protein
MVAIATLISSTIGSAMDVFNPDDYLCRSSHVVVATVIKVKDSGCFDNTIKWQDELSRGVACDPNHVGPQLIRIKEILGTGNPAPLWDSHRSVAVGDMLWVRPEVQRAYPVDAVLNGKLGSLVVKGSFPDRPLTETELRSAFIDRNFIFAISDVDPSQGGTDPNLLPINAHMYGLKMYSWIIDTIRRRSGGNCVAPYLQKQQAKTFP